MCDKPSSSPLPYLFNNGDNLLPTPPVDDPSTPLSIQQPAALHVSVNPTELQKMRYLIPKHLYLFFLLSRALFLTHFLKLLLFVFIYVRHHKVKEGMLAFYHEQNVHCGESHSGVRLDIRRTNDNKVSNVIYTKILDFSPQHATDMVNMFPPDILKDQKTFYLTLTLAGKHNNTASFSAYICFSNNHRTTQTSI